MFDILMNWEELKAYFTSAELAQSQFGTKFRARLLKEMLSDNKSTCSLSLQHLLCRNLKDLNSPFQQTKILMNCTNKFWMVVPCIWFEIRVNYQLDANICLF